MTGRGRPALRQHRFRAMGELTMARVYTWSMVSLSPSAISRQWDSARAYYIAREDDGQDERTKKGRMRLRPGRLGWVSYDYSRRWAATGEIIAANLHRCRETFLPGLGCLGCLGYLSSALQPAPQLHHLYMRWSNRHGRRLVGAESRMSTSGLAVF